MSAKIENSVTEMAPSHDAFDDMLNATNEPYEIVACEYEPAYLLKNVDRAAYDEAYNDWIDGKIRWQCDACGSDHQYESQAADCCAHWECGECGTQYDDEDDADLCCEDDEEVEE